VSSEQWFVVSSDKRYKEACRLKKNGGFFVLKSKDSIYQFTPVNFLLSSSC